MGECMVYHVEGAMFAGKECATALSLVFYKCHLHQGSWQCSSDLCIFSFFNQLFYPLFGMGSKNI